MIRGKGDSVDDGIVIKNNNNNQIIAKRIVFIWLDFSGGKSGIISYTLTFEWCKALWQTWSQFRFKLFSNLNSISFCSFVLCIVIVIDDGSFRNALTTIEIRKPKQSKIHAPQTHIHTHMAYIHACKQTEFIFLKSKTIETRTRKKPAHTDTAVFLSRARGSKTNATKRKKNRKVAENCSKHIDQELEWWQKTEEIWLLKS